VIFLRAKLNDKRDDLNFPSANFIYRNIPAAPVYKLIGMDVNEHDTVQHYT
jgi:hypothetical protein